MLSARALLTVGRACEREVSQELHLLADDVGLGDAVQLQQRGAHSWRQSRVGSAVVCQQDAHVQGRQEQPLAVGRLVEVVVARGQEAGMLRRRTPCSTTTAAGSI